MGTEIVRVIDIHVGRLERPSEVCGEFEKEGFVTYNSKVHGPIPAGIVRESRYIPHLPDWGCTMVVLKEA